VDDVEVNVSKEDGDQDFLLEFKLMMQLSSSLEHPLTRMRGNKSV